MSKINNVKEKIIFLKNYSKKINIMEVCGTHTMAISKLGLRTIISPNINLISGPGCPVCVTPDSYLDYVYNLSLNKEIIIATYGDMIRVPGSVPENTLERAKALGANVRIVYSSMDAVKIAEENKNYKVVFLGIGFETTTPATAIAIKEAYERKIENFYVLSLHKIVEPIMRAVMEDKDFNIDGFLCPGHVAVIIGEDGLKFLEEYKCSGVIAGFDLEGLINSIYEIVIAVEKKEYKVKNCYSELVKKEGNTRAKSLVNEIFEIKDDYWRGIGKINSSGLKLKEKYSEFDIEKLYSMTYFENKSNKRCQCGDVIMGKAKPSECPLFGKVCTPDNPVGPCMVSSEGSCAAYYKYQSLE